MKYIQITILLLFVFLVNGVYSQIVKEQTALKVAENVYQQIQQIQAMSKITPVIEIINDKNGQAAYYVFKYGSANGYIVISAEKNVFPLLAYSSKGIWDSDSPCPAHDDWMNTYVLQIEDVRQNNIKATQEIISQWNKYTQNDPGATKSTRLIVGPFTDYITWDQNCLYNDSCPPDAAGPCGHAYAGCVASAMSIVMKYHHHPNTGTGSHSYSHPTYGTLSANFASTDYNFASMPDFIAEAYVAQLMYQTGVSVDMNYGPTGSSASTSVAVNSLVTFFNYSSSAYYDLKANHTDPVWEGMVKTELDNSRPLLYRGQGTGGHAFVCDGYDDNYSGGGLTYFHFNWGWSGAYNGYYHLSNLNPGGNNFTSDQAAGFNIEPRTDITPTSDFNADANTACVGSSVNFYDMSSYSPNGWSWTFPGGASGSSTSEDPTETYNTPGLYDVTLTASNASGAGTTESKTGFIRVCNTPVSATCYPITTTLGNYWYGIIHVKLSNLDHYSGDALYDSGCLDLICSHSADLTPGSTYNLDIMVRVGSSGNAHTYVWIDFNNDGDFTDAGETMVNNEISSVASSYNTFSTSLTMPSSPTTGTMLRMRVWTDYTTAGSPCSNAVIGQSEDYGIYFVAGPSAPVATAATNISQTAFDANWNASTSATGYYLDVATDAGFTSFVSGYDNLDVGNVTTKNVTGLNAGSDYYYRVRAYNANGTSGNSNIISLTTTPNAPSAPVATAATNISQTSFDANWNVATGATGYYLDVATDAGFTTFVSGYDNLDVSNVTTYNVSGLSAATDYYYRIRAYNSGGTSGNSNVISLTTLPNPPNPPVATAATNISQTAFDANWNASTDTDDLTFTADGYYLDVATDAGFTSFVSGYQNLDVGNVTTYSVTALSAQTDYYYRVRAYNTGGTSSNSNVISVTTTPNAPSPPVATAATNIAQTSFDANWDASSGATGYYLDVATDNGFTSMVPGYDNLDVSNVTTYSVSGLSAQTDYYYRIRAYNTGGTSSNSNIISLTTLPNPPAAPVATAATNVQQTFFEANWDASTGATGYYLDVATDNGFTSMVPGYDNLDVSNVTTYNVTGLSAQTDYYYRVRAYNTGGASANSNVISVTTLPFDPNAPVALPATNIQQTSFDANWEAVAGAITYYLDVATDIAFTSFVAGYNNLNTGNVTIYSVSGLTGGTDYYYRVRSETGGGTSSNSNIIVVTTLPGVPLPPTALPASMIQASSFDANWDPSAGADGYYLDVATDNGFVNLLPSYDNLDVGNLTTYSVTGLDPDTYYYYRLRAYNISGTSGNSNIVEVITLMEIPLPPVAINATLIQSHSFNANWEPSLGADAYYLDVSSDNSFGSYLPGFENLDVGNTNTYAVTGVSPNSTYYYRLRAYNNGGTSGNSNTVSVTTLPVGLSENNLQVKIFSLHAKVIITTKGFDNIEGEAYVYSMGGLVLLKKKLDNADENILNPGVRNQICIVKTIINGKQYIEKVFVSGY